MANDRNVIEIVVEAINRTAPGLSSAASSLASFSQKFPLLAGVATVAIDRIVQEMGQMARAVAEAYQEVVRVGDAFDDMSRRTKMSVETLSSWEYIIEKAGGSAADFEQNVTKLRREMAHAADGQKESVRRFAELGISATDASGRLRPVEDVLLDIAKAMQGAGDESKKMAAANELVGRGSQAIMGVFKDGPDSIRRDLDTVRKLNGQLTTEFGKSSAAVADAQTNVKFAWRGLKADLSQGINWEVAMATNKLALVLAYLGGGMDQIKSKVESVRFEFSPFKDPAQINAGVNKMAEAMAISRRAALEKMAKDFGVQIQEWKIDPVTLKLSPVLREDEEIVKDISASAQRVMIKASKDAEEELKNKQLMDIALLVADSYRDVKVSPVFDFRQNERDRAKSERSFNDLMQSVMSIDLDAIIPDSVKFNPEPPKKVTAALQAMAEAAADVAYGFQDIASSAISAFLSGQTHALMFGQMIQTVLIQAISNLIAKLLIARALSSFFGLFGGAGNVIGTITGTTNAEMGKNGLDIPRAARGFTVPGGGGDFFPPVILPGSPGLDRTPVLATGGEMLISRSTVNAAQRMIGQTLTGPRPSGKRGGSSGRLKVEFRADRPFRTSEQIRLRDSVNEAIARGGRYNA